MLRSRQLPHLLLLATLLALSLAGAAGCRTTIRAEGTRPSTEVRENSRPPAAAFFRNPLLSHVAISPDGAHIAAIMERDGKEMLILRETRGGKPRALTSLERTRRRSSWRIRQLGWANDEQILISVELPADSIQRGAPGRASRLLLVDAHGERSTRYLGRRWPYQYLTSSQDQIIHWLPRDPEHVLLTLWMPGDRGAGARAVNLVNGTLHLVARPETGSTWWAADHRGQVRAGGGEAKTSSEHFLLARVGADDDFMEIQRYDPYSEPGFGFAGFSPDPQRIYVTSSKDTGRAALYSYDLRARRLGDRVFAHPEVDVGAISTSGVDGRLLGVSYVTDREHFQPLDPEEERIWNALSAALPDTTNRYVSWDREEKLAIVVSSGDTHPPRYYLFDRETLRLDLLFDAYPELERAELAPMQAVAYEARDGLRIHGYLTVPLRGSPPWPAILLPHGGPWVRDVWGWNPVVQYLASRGFAVLQPNFRGSTGYGTAFRERGYASWGEAMQDDITDGALWLVDRGIADRSRIGIYGASYGGFAALEALIREPDLFRAGASLAGVTDLPALLHDAARYWSLQDDLERLIGDRRKDGERLRAISPVDNAQAIRAPVLIAHGIEDPTVPVSQAYEMIDALQNAGVSVEPLIYEGALHGFIDERNAIDFYEKLGSFFERNLAPPGDDPGP